MSGTGTTSRWGLRVLGLGYILILLLLPLGLIFYKTFEHGIAPPLDAITSPDGLHALKLTLLMVAIALPIILALTFHIAGIRDPGRITHTLGYVISIVLVYIASVLLYRLLPNLRVSWAFAARGGAIVAIPWPIVQYAFAVYVTHVDFTRIYGALSAPIVLLLWFYCIGSIFLFGAEYSAALSTGYQSVLREG